ncbi:hypothetical protein [Rubrivirga sp.]|uniref:hypothetical protein n=1 Tax=Rubrivirga sp. TaxID=1885344 RepID=UPI003B52621C
MRLATLALIAVVAWGCASGKRAYTDGMALETSGDYAAASDAYATALERDPSLPNVAGRLAVAGREAVRQAVARAAGLDPEGAALSYRRAQALVDRAAALGVDFRRPARFEADRDAAYAAAVDALLDGGTRAYDAADFPGALDRAARARTFGPSAGQADALDRLVLDTRQAWAEADLDAGHVRAALAHADAALALGPDPARAVALEDLRGAIVDAGRLVVAVFPTEGGDLPEAFRRDLTDALADDHLRDAGPFVVLVDPADVRRWDRGRRRGPALGDSPRRLGRAALDLGADLGAVVVLGDLSEREVAGDARAETVRVRSTGDDAVISARQIQIDLTTNADVVVVDAGGRPVCDVAVEARGRASYDRATTAGDWRALDLSRRQRAAFADDAADRAYSDALVDLREHLAQAVADRLRECLDARVP